MKTNLMKNLLLIALLFFSHVVAAFEIKWSGYGSIIAGVVLDGDVDPYRGDGTDTEFVADFYDVGVYDEDISFLPESILALQANTQISDDLYLTAQLVAKGVDDFQPEFDWYYLTYIANPEWKIMVGRRNIPMYYFSEYMEVGYVYPWIRPPANVYWWQITQFNGITASYNFFFGDGEYANTLNVFYGNERSPNNAEMTYYAEIGFYGNMGLVDVTPVGTAVTVDEYWKNIMGFNWNVSHDLFELRFSLFQNELDRDIHYVNNVMGAPRYAAGEPEEGIVNAQVDQLFVGFGGQINLEPVTLLFDYNLSKRNKQPDTEYTSYLLSAVYSMGDYQPYISYSKADQDDTTATGGNTDDREEHELWSIGLRYDFAQKAAFKIQYDKMTDQGSVYNGWNFHGDAEVIAAGVDFIF